jgi:pseudouridine-5'-phosphate glycosidase
MHICTSSLFPRQLTHYTLFALPPSHSERGVHGNDVTPFLLQRVNELTGGESLKSSTSAVGCENVPEIRESLKSLTPLRRVLVAADICLIKQNAKVAAQIASALSVIRAQEKVGTK